MRISQHAWARESGWRVLADDGVERASLVLYFGGPGIFEDGTRYEELRARYGSAHLVGCSTGGEILGDEVYDDSIAATAIEFCSTRVALAQTAIAAHGGDACAAGRALAEQLPSPGLRSVFLLSDGTRVNGSELVRGVHECCGDGVPFTGGLAGDGASFGTTRVGIDANPAPGIIGAIGFYGDAIRFGYGSAGGWDPVGPERRITRAVDNTLYELDGRSALDLYKTYLGPEAANLPASALLLPLRVRTPERPDDESVVRTVISIDEATKGMVFAGDIHEGQIAQMMLGNFEHLIDGAGRAAAQARIPGNRLAILISCIGRKLLLGQRIVEEVEAVQDQLGSACAVTGLYSYGEIGPHGASSTCDLHNQTMTVMTVAED
jgi:hypothetical protein